MKILIASDKFKGLLTAREAGEALGEGLDDLLPDASIEVAPVSDGGDGLGQLLLDELGGETISVDVSGPLGGVAQAPLRLLRDGSAVVEMASGSGLAMVDPSDLRPLAASSLGAGQLMRAAFERSVKRVIVGVGGSASTDGGTAAATAMGWRFLDMHGQSLPRGGASLWRLAHIEAPATSTSVEVIGAVDVGVPLTGLSGAAFQFSPQKGASKTDVLMLEFGLRRLAYRIRKDLGIDTRRISGGGAGGGMGAGLHAFFGATLISGFDLLAQTIDLRAAIERADVVITGEGRLDRQTLAGKAPSKVAALARSLGKTCIAVVGSSMLSEVEATSSGFSKVVTTTMSSGLPTKSQAVEQIKAAALRVSVLLP